MAKAQSEQDDRLIEFWSHMQHFLDTRRQSAMRAGLSPAQYEMLLAVSAFHEHNDSGISAVADRLLMQHRVAGRVVKVLTNQGLLLVERSVRDRRSHILKLTPKGKRLLDRLAGNSIGGLEREGPALAKSLVRVIH